MPENKNIFTILRTKLHRPQITSDLVSRPQLVQRLEEGLQKPLTLVSAPAGYGKSTLLSSWLEQTKSPFTWLSLNEDDDDLPIFLRYVIAALQLLFPSSMKETSQVLDAHDLPPFKSLTTSLINEIDAIGKSFILVLDDYHRIKNEKVHDLLNEILRHPPRSLHMVVTARKDPPLELYSLRGGSLINEFRTNDLVFSDEETAVFLKNVYHESFKTDLGPMLNKKTEGWVAGMRLLTSSIRDSILLENKLGDIKANYQTGLEDIISDMIKNQTEMGKEFLLKSSILSNFNASMVDYLCEFTVLGTSQKMIDWLESANLFIIGLDDKHEWFRYHHLFRNLLNLKLQELYNSDQISHFHFRAGEYLSQEGELGEAIWHFQQSDHPERALQLFKNYRQELLNSVQWQKLERLLRLFPASQQKTDVKLLLTKAWVLVYQGKAIEMFELLDFIESLLVKENVMSGDLYGELMALSTWYSYNVLLDYEKCIGQAETAISQLNSDNTYPAGIAWVFWGGALQCTGRVSQAIEGIYQQLDKKPSDLLKSMLLLILNYIYWLEGDLINLQSSASQLIEIGKKQMHQEAMVNGLYFAGIAQYHQNNLDQALEVLEKAYIYRFHTIGIHHINILSALNWVYLESGELQSAKKVVTDFSDFAVDKGNPYYALLQKALEAEMNFRLGNKASAQNWAENTEDLPLYPFSNFYTPQMILIKILIYMETDKSRERAGALLDEIEQYLLKSNNKRFLLEVYAMQGLLLFDLGKQEQAFVKLKKAISLAEPYGFIRIFVDLGAKMATLLKGLADKNISVGYLGRLLATFRQKELLTSPEMSPAVSSLQKKATKPLIQYDLTNREHDILELLKLRLSNKEIAQKLILSPETIKKHTKNIYQKLNVNSRQEAVEKANLLGLF